MVDLQEKRINSVQTLLSGRPLSPWAKKYWNYVLEELLYARAINETS
jgi:hypothetical protein